MCPSPPHSFPPSTHLGRVQVGPETPQQRGSARHVWRRHRGAAHVAVPVDGVHVSGGSGVRWGDARSCTCQWVARVGGEVTGEAGQHRRMVMPGGLWCTLPAGPPKYHRTAVPASDILPNDLFCTTFLNVELPAQTLPQTQTLLQKTGMLSRASGASGAYGLWKVGHTVEIAVYGKLGLRSMAGGACSLWQAGLAVYGRWGLQSMAGWA
eukprot:364521-Chlamydomonas_euryale.AAC.8